MEKKYSVAIVGATGLVGQTMLKVLFERKFPVKELVLYSMRGGRCDTPFGETEVLSLTQANIYHHPCDFALFAVDSDVSIRFAQIFSTMGTIVVDNSSAWRMDNNVPLVIPEVNPSAAFMHNGIIANPNCTTAQILTAVAPLHRAFGIKKMIVSTYQSVSGAGNKALGDLFSGGSQALGIKIRDNMIPKIDKYVDGGYTAEELKIVNETHKILSRDIKVNATCVRVPLSRCHGASVHLELNTAATLSDVSKSNIDAPSVKLLDAPTPLDILESDGVLVGRLRRDSEGENSFCMWIVADNLRKGAAANAVQILELLI